MTADTSIETHFEFGRNWDSFFQNLSDERIAEAVDGLRRLLPDEIPGASFIDIGSGSGLSALAALRLGCASLTAIDYDAMSVKTTRETLTRYAPAAAWTCERRSVFDLAPETDGRFGVVYSWGVLHHTGDMWRAIDASAALVAEQGHLALALYARSPLCGFWRREKRLYTHGPRWLRQPLEWIYKAVYVVGLLLSGRNPSRYIAAYKSNRGMNWHHDVIDWLGGYPYESVSPQALEAHMTERGFRLVRQFVRLPPSGGLLGSPCNEFVFQRIVSA